MPNIELLPTSEAAKILGRDVRTVHRWADSGRLPFAGKTPGIRGGYLFNANDIQRLADELADRQGTAA